MFFFGILKNVCDIVVKRFTFAISSADEFLFTSVHNTQRSSLLAILDSRVLVLRLVTIVMNSLIAAWHASHIAEPSATSCYSG